jgi:DNA-binding response OmpR family regulator
LKFAGRQTLALFKLSQNTMISLNVRRTYVEEDGLMKVMVVEDELDIRDILKNLLEEEGFEVVALANSQNIIEEIHSNSPDLLLLDQVLPGKNGIDALREVRANQQYARLPVIMVTGLSGEQDKVGALNVGADDYVTKPFFPKELTARIKALVRRSTLVGGEAPEPVRIELNGIVMNFTEHRVWVEGVEVALTLTEFKILGEMLKQNTRVLSRERLRESALGNLNVTDRTIDVHMASLRKKLGIAGHRVETVRGVGYRFANPSSDSSG